MSLTKRQWGELGLIVALALVMTLLAVGAGRFDLISVNRATTLYDHEYGQVHVPVTKRHRIEGDWDVTEQGLRLAPGRRGRIAVRMHNNQEGRLTLLLYGRPTRGFSTQVSISDGNQVVRTVGQDLPLDGRRLDLTPAAGGIEEGWVVVDAVMVPGSSGRESGMLTRIRLVSVYGPVSLPNLSLASVLVLTPALAYLLRAHLRRTGALPYGLAVLCGMALLADSVGAWGHQSNVQWWEHVLRSQQFHRYYLLPYAVLLALVAWHVWGTQVAPHLERVWSHFTLVGVLVMAGSLRVAALAETGWGQLDPDTITYRLLAHNMTSPYDTGHREPLWIWIFKVWFWIVGDSQLHIRLLTILLSLIMIALAYKLFRDYTGRPQVGLLVAGLLAINPYLISLSVRGLREEAYLIAIVVFVYLLLVPHQRWSLRSIAVGLGVTGAAAQLLRFNSYTFLIPLLAFWAWRQGTTGWKAVLVSVGIITVLSVPHLVHNYQTFGDPLYSVNLHFAWARNYEFVVFKKTGCDGCPTREQTEIDATRGAPISGFEYLFGLHSVKEVFTTTLRGYVETYLTPTSLFEMQSGTRSILGYTCYLLGLVLIALTAYREMLVVVLLLANAIPFAIAMGIDARLGIQTAPFISFILACGVWFPLERLVEMWRSASRGVPLLIPRDRHGLRHLWQALLRV